MTESNEFFLPKMTERNELSLYTDNSEESRKALELCLVNNLPVNIIEESGGRVPRLEDIHHTDSEVTSSVTYFNAKGVEYYLVKMYRERSD